MSLGFLFRVLQAAYRAIIVAGVTCPNFGWMLSHSISILLTTYAHFIPIMQDQAAQLMDEILTPIPIELETKS